MNISDHERSFFERHLDSFVPDKVFDAHCHIWNSPQNCSLLPELPDSMDYETLRYYLDMLHPGRKLDVILVSMPVGDIAGNNMQAAEEIKNTPSGLGLMCVRPEDSPHEIEKQMAATGLRGLKVYHIFSAAKPTWQADIPEYLPECLMELANSHKWIVMLHMVKSRALADEANLGCIKRYCENYPDVRLILAHSARGFQPEDNLDALKNLARYDNLFFDSSANCEPVAHQSVIRYMGHEKLLYGSDFYISHFRGRSFSAGDSFLWLYDDNPVWGKLPPIFVGLENIRSLKWACWSEKLSDSQIEDIFYNNASRVLR